VIIGSLPEHAREMVRVSGMQSELMPWAGLVASIHRHRRESNFSSMGSVRRMRAYPLCFSVLGAIPVTNREWQAASAVTGPQGIPVCLYRCLSGHECGNGQPIRRVLVKVEIGWLKVPIPDLPPDLRE